MDGYSNVFFTSGTRPYLESDVFVVAVKSFLQGSVFFPYPLKTLESFGFLILSGWRRKGALAAKDIMA